MEHASPIVVGIDPGTAMSAVVVYDGKSTNWIFDENMEVLNWIKSRWQGMKPEQLRVAIEMVASYGMAVGKSVFETCVWIGRFDAAWFDHLGVWPDHIYRTTIKTHFCGSVRAKDSNIRQALIDRFGEPGTKKNPNPVTYGLSRDLWSAFAVATYTYDLRYARKFPCVSVSSDPSPFPQLELA